MKKCPFFDVCGGCSYDFSDSTYREKKLSCLPKKIKFTSEPIWGIVGTRRRAEFAFVDGHLGFYKKQTKDIVDIHNCLNLVPEINTVLHDIANLPLSASGSILITKCENGLDVGINCDLPYFGPEFKKAVEKLPPSIIRFTWNGKAIRQYAEPEIKFDKKIVEYPPNVFLQPTAETEKILRDMVVEYVGDAKRVADLFCGLGNFTYATNATGFDIVGNGMTRDLFKKTLSVQNLNQYDVIIMDPPRAGALNQSKEIAKSNVYRVIYISCNPNTFIRDSEILTCGGYKMTVAVPIDQFVGSSHWEIFSVFEK